MSRSRIRVLVVTSVALLVLVAGGILLFLATNRNNQDRGQPLPITLTPLAARRVSGVPYVLVHPLPGTQLTLEEYKRGMLSPVSSGRTNDQGIYNICVFTEPRAGRDRYCLTPPTLDPSCRNYPELEDADFWNGIVITLDGNQISGGRLGSQNTLEETAWHNPSEYSLCYRVPLNVGTHTMTYTFDWKAANVVDKAQWDFTVRP